MIRCPYCWSTDAGHDADADHGRALTMAAAIRGAAIDDATRVFAITRDALRKGLGAGSAFSAAISPAEGELDRAKAAAWDAFVAVCAELEGQPRRMYGPTVPDALVNDDGDRVCWACYLDVLTDDGDRDGLTDTAQTARCTSRRCACCGAPVDVPPCEYGCPDCRRRERADEEEGRADYINGRREARGLS